MTKEQDTALFERSVVALEKLAFEAARLRSDVARLAGRIEPFENEHEIAVEQGYHPKLSSFRDVLNYFQQVRDDLRASENKVQRIAGIIDQIQNDSWSRQDMRPWLKDR